MRSVGAERVVIDADRRKLPSALLDLLDVFGGYFPFPRRLAARPFMRYTTQASLVAFPVSHYRPAIATR